MRSLSSDSGLHEQAEELKLVKDGSIGDVGFSLHVRRVES